MSMQQLFHTLLPYGLHSRTQSTHRQGVVFAVRDKAHFANGHVQGQILTTTDALYAQHEAFSHFTPNVYRFGTYTNDARTYIKGFSEDNLQQINTFVVDIDTKRYTPNDILLTCMDESIGLPTCIIETTRGYQVYFVLAEPLFISNKDDFRGLHVAKRISDNLKRSLQAVEADRYCNDFGFFRMPTRHNVVYVDVTNTYTMHQYIQWSMRQDDDIARPLFVLPAKQHTSAMSETPWFQALLQTTHIRGTKGTIGRNNTLFTIALIAYAEGWDKATAQAFVHSFNRRLQAPLRKRDVEAIIQSAYSGKYNGPKKEYIEALLCLHVENGAQYTVTLPANVWYKFKKERHERTRSHFEEWEQDIIDYITVQKSSTEPFLWHTQKELCAAVGIAQSSLNELLKRSTKLIKTITGKGRGAKTGWTTVAHFMQYITAKLVQQQAQYRTHIQTLIKQHVAQLAPIAGYETVLTRLHIVFEYDRTTLRLSG